MKRSIFLLVAVFAVVFAFSSCGGETNLQNKAISYMQTNVFENGEWEAGDTDMDEIEDALVDLGAPKFKSGQHAVELVVDLYGIKQSYIVWMQDNKVMHYEQTGSVNVGKISRSIYPSLTEKGWR